LIQINDFFLNHSTAANALACFIPIDIAIETTVNLESANVFAMFPYRFHIGALII
jgi:hypothetical protein